MIGLIPVFSIFIGLTKCFLFWFLGIQFAGQESLSYVLPLYDAIVQGCSFKTPNRHDKMALWGQTRSVAGKVFVQHGGNLGFDPPDVLTACGGTGV